MRFVENTFLLWSTGCLALTVFPWVSRHILRRIMFTPFSVSFTSPKSTTESSKLMDSPGTGDWCLDSSSYTSFLPSCTNLRSGSISGERWSR